MDLSVEVVVGPQQFEDEGVDVGWDRGQRLAIVGDAVWDWPCLVVSWTDTSLRGRMNNSLS